jgi:hypothetical protein
LAFCGVALVVIFPMAVVSCRLDTPSKSYCSSGSDCFTCQKSRRSIGSEGSKCVGQSLRLHRGRRILTWRSNVFDDGTVEFVVASRVEDRGDEGSKITATARSKSMATTRSNFLTMKGVEFLDDERGQIS